MRHAIRRLVLLALVGATLLPAPSHALVNSQCGDNYTRTTSCMFTVVGPNLTVSGHTSVAGIVVRVTDPTGNARVFECTGQFSCISSLGIPPTGTDSVGPPAGVGPLRCTVITSGSGYYRCQSTV